MNPDQFKEQFSTGPTNYLSIASEWLYYEENEKNDFTAKRTYKRKEVKLYQWAQKQLITYFSFDCIVKWRCALAPDFLELDKVPDRYRTLGFRTTKLPFKTTVLIVKLGGNLLFYCFYISSLDVQAFRKRSKDGHQVESNQSITGN